MPIDLSVVVVLLGAGVLAGAVGTAGGITSLVSYPVLLAVGVPPLQASVVNLVAVVACWPGSAWSSRHELGGTGRWLGRGLPVAAAGGAAGSILLLSTSAAVFTRIVPLLVLAGSVALLASPALVALRRGGPDGRGPAPALAGVALLSVYGGYFGAGSGVMLLTLALVLVHPGLPRANAAKNMLVGAAGLASAAVFIVAGPVDWAAAAPLAAGMLVGSTVGPTLTRRLPERLVRWVVSVMGFALALDLWLRSG